MGGKFRYEKGMISLGEFAIRIGITHGTALKWLHKGRVPFHLQGQKIYGIVFEEAIQAPYVAEYIRVHGLPVIEERHDPRVLAQRPRIPPPSENFDPLYSKTLAPTWSFRPEYSPKKPDCVGADSTKENECLVSTM